jgi:hemoglobin
MHLQDIQTLDDVKLLVNKFYEKVRGDETFADIFNERIGNKWPEHLEKMYRFWQTVLLEEYTYFGAPFPPHANLPVAHFHFEKWLKLFHATVDDFIHR